MTAPSSSGSESTYELLRQAARNWPDAIATQWIPDPADHLRCLALTYADLAGAATRIANGLAALGVRRADAVTLCGPNSSGLLAATLAAQAAGIAAPVNPALSAERIAGLIRRTRSQVLIAAGPEADPELWQRLTGVARQTGIRWIVALRPDGATGHAPALRGEPGLDAQYLEELSDGQPSDRLARISPPAAGDLAAFVHTGGTTGAPKIAAHTHANQLACARGIAESAGLAPGDGVLAGLPLFHVNALIVTGIAPLLSGTRVVWPGPAGYRAPALYQRFWKVIKHYQIVAMSAVPTVYGALAQVPVDADISSLRIPIVGASPLPTAVREGFARHTGRRLLEGYGLTEATCASTWNRPGADRPGSVGQVLPGQQVKAVRVGADGSWQDCAPGEPGVLVIGGPAVFAGYVIDPSGGGDRVSKGDTVRDGWLDTGDLGQVDARWLRLPHRPGQGPDHPQRPQYRPARNRRSAARASRCHGRGGGRLTRCLRGRGARRLRRPGRCQRVRRGRAARVGREDDRRAGRPAQADIRHPGHPGHRRRQALQACAGRRRRAAGRRRGTGPRGRPGCRRGDGDTGGGGPERYRARR